MSLALESCKVGLAEHIQFLWEKTVISMLSNWASELSEEARALQPCGDTLCALDIPGPQHLGPEKLWQRTVGGMASPLRN